MTEQAISNALLLVMLILFSLALYLNYTMFLLFKKKMTSDSEKIDNKTLTDELRMEEKYLFTAPIVKRAPIARTDVSLWEQEIADSKK
jgi:hypothetical protein